METTAYTVNIYYVQQLSHEKNICLITKRWQAHVFANHGTD